MIKQTIYSLLKMLAVVAIATFSSCSDMYDSLKEFATEETIYPGRYDKISGQVGFERVEIDLSSKGRIPASEMKLANAKKTVVECDYFDAPLVIDTVSSWVNITGLTRPEAHTFLIYTEDENGNRSTPSEITLVPYTTTDLEQMELLSPKKTESTSTVLYEWESKLSGLLFDCYSYEYEYTDKNGKLQSGSGSGDLPSFFVENVSKGTTYPIKLTLQIVPKKNNLPILDKVDWTTIIPLTISELASDVIFLKTPAAAEMIDLNDPITPQPHLFSWSKVDAITDYTLKFSTSSSFAPENTLAISVGDVTSYELKAPEISNLVARGSGRCYWTVEPTSPNPAVKTQARVINVYRDIKPYIWWDFDDMSDPFKANSGEALIPEGGGIVSVDGPSPNDKAIYVPEWSFLTGKHGIPPTTGKNFVNEYTLLMNVKQTYFTWFSVAEINRGNSNGELFFSYEGEVSLNGWWWQSSEFMKLNTWNEVVYSMKIGEYVKIFINGNLVKTITSSPDWVDGDYALRPEIYFFRDDDSWNDICKVQVSEIRMWNFALNEMEASHLKNLNWK